MELTKIIKSAIITIFALGILTPGNINYEPTNFNKCDLLTKEFYYNREHGPRKLMYCIEQEDGIKTLYHYQQGGLRNKIVN